MISYLNVLLMISAGEEVSVQAKRVAEKDCKPNIYLDELVLLLINAIV